MTRPVSTGLLSAGWTGIARTAAPHGPAPDGVNSRGEAAGAIAGHRHVLSAIAVERTGWIERTVHDLDGDLVEAQFVPGRSSR